MHTKDSILQEIYKLHKEIEAKHGTSIFENIPNRDECELIQRVRQLREKYYKFTLL